ncbi:MAG: DUF1232 domain-containing protein [Dehalococcoidia bacterium]|nr:DUF1232 domain-containing protein [Dehalococcoidia bacterium]
MLLPLIPVAGIGFLVFKIVRIRRRGRPFLQLSHAERLEFARLVIRDGAFPVVPRGLVALAAAYLALPIDFIPDFIPIIGHADDFIVVTLLIGIITRAVPQDRLGAIISQARLARSARTSRRV